MRLLTSPRHRDAPLPNSVALGLRQIAEAVAHIYWYMRSATLLH